MHIPCQLNVIELWHGGIRSFNSTATRIAILIFTMYATDWILSYPLSVMLFDPAGIEAIIPDLNVGTLRSWPDLGATPSVPTHLLTTLDVLILENPRLQISALITSTVPLSHIRIGRKLSTYQFCVFYFCSV